MVGRPEYLWMIVVAGIVWSIIKGRLVPRSTVDKLLSIKDQQIALLSEESRDGGATLVGRVEVSRRIQTPHRPQQGEC